jgi:hypothetical protein
LYGESHYKGVGKIVNNETFLKTAVENKRVCGKVKRTISTEYGQSISWKSFDANILYGKYPG